MDRILCNRYGDFLFRQGESRELASGEVRLRVEAAIALPQDIYPPVKGVVPGRWFCARVEETAYDVTRVFEDDCVTLLPTFDSEEGIQILGVTMDGCFQQEMIVREEILSILPIETEPLIGACFAPLAILCDALLDEEPAYGRRIGIAGCDFYGCLAIQAAKALGYSPVCALDASEAWRRRAVKHGAAFTINLSNEHAAARLRNLTEGGLEKILDTGENPGSEEQTLTCLADGGKAILLDLGGRKMDLSEDALAASRKRNTSWTVDRPFDRVIRPAAVRAAHWLIANQKIHMDELVDRTIPLSALPGAWEDAKAGLVRGILAIEPNMNWE